MVSEKDRSEAAQAIVDAFAKFEGIVGDHAHAMDYQPVFCCPGFIRMERLMHDQICSECPNRRGRKKP